MSVLILLIGVSLTVALVFLLAFLWASTSGQYEDDYTPSVRMLFDDNLPTKQKKSSSPTPSKK
ncbi:cbb3-type cytochrome oxidase assembly protein CcoS [Tunicatimonas pelagia]|uniref:cbb3-type cytochrome oxidase assembly protein CcoS n=1 Tax=Tunicatimonas pelagia TaxID=931531 RepID=UPI002666BE6C|nr:cbb3-type cytochrome oxidase assembly protein CcoS [Tunicatimonas pelagia]WKN41140.1 cbb3-type cytochrome oxidase assembly protein CcoS [Tunicatimonas pelagia]